MENAERETLAVRVKKMVYREGNTAVKVFSDDYAQSDVLNEALNQTRAVEAGIPAPHVLEVKKIDGRWAIVSEFIRGKTLAALMEEEPERLEEYLELFVELQMSVHAKEAPLLGKLKDKMNRKISETTLDATTRYELHTRLDAMPKHKKVCHGDFNPSNIIMDENGRAWILDWSHVTQGNASADVARTYLLFCLAGKQEIGDRYLDLFCEKSHTARKYVQNWMPIVAASQSVKGKPEERELLLSWVNVADY